MSTGRSRSRAAAGTGTLVVLSAPSGCGKSTVVKRWLERNPNLVRSVSATTRQPRPEEKDGRDYRFLTAQRFLAEDKRDAFLESASVFGQSYGTPRRPVEEALAAGKDVVLVIDVQGAREVRRKLPCLSIFLVPPTFQELRRRLAARGECSLEELELRLSQAQAEMACAKEFDHTVLNDSVDRAARELQRLLAAAKKRNGARL